MNNITIHDIINFFKPVPITRIVFHFLSGGIVSSLVVWYIIMVIFMFSDIDIVKEWIIGTILLVIFLLYTVYCRLIDVHKYGWIVGVFFIGCAIFLSTNPFPNIRIELHMIYVFSLIAAILSLSILSGRPEISILEHNENEKIRPLFRFFLQVLIFEIIIGVSLSLGLKDTIPETNQGLESITTTIGENTNEITTTGNINSQEIIHLLKVQDTEGSIDPTPTQESPYTINTKSTKTDDTTPRIMMRPGKVNQYVNPISESWESDGDGESGAEIDPLLYCKKWYPGTIRTESYKQETIATWKSGGNAGNYTGTRTSIACIQH